MYRNNLNKLDVSREYINTYFYLMYFRYTNLFICDTNFCDARFDLTRPDVKVYK